MSFQDKPREPRAPRKARARTSLKMQAIGFLSRREHSRQELRAKLLDSLRKWAREEAALAAAADKAAQELAQALSEQPPNGIDDAFGPAPAPVPAPAPAPAIPRVRRTRPPAPCDLDTTRPSVIAAAPARAALATLSLANGAPLPEQLRDSLAAPDLRASGLASVSMAGNAVHDRPSSDHDLERTLERTDPEAAVDELLDWLAANNYLSETRFVESRVNARSRKQGALRIKLELSRHGLALEPEQAATLRESEFARAQALWQRKFGAIASDARERARQARFLAARGFAADAVRRIVGGQDED